jgi:hypothetical protein
MISKKLLAFPLLFSSISFNSQANVGIEYETLKVRCEDSKGWGYDFYNDYINGKLHGLKKYNNGQYELAECPLPPKNKAKLNLDNESSTTISQSSSLPQQTISKRINKETSFVPTKDLIKYGALFEISEEEIGGWEKIYFPAGKECGSMSCLEYLIIQSKRRGINPALSLGLVAQESSFCTANTTKSSATGCFQIIKKTGRDLGLNPEQRENIQLNINAGLDNIKDGMDIAKRNGLKGEKLELGMIRYHMTGSISGNSEEFEEQRSILPGEISLIEEMLEISEDFWNNNPCSTIYKSSRYSPLDIISEKDYTKLAKTQVVAGVTTNKNDIKLTKACLEDMNPNVFEFPQRIDKLGITYKYGLNCKSDIQQYLLNNEFKSKPQVESFEINPKINFGETQACMGIHFN